MTNCTHYSATSILATGLLIAAIAVLAVPAEAQEKDAALEVRVLVYSGLPDPEFSLSATDDRDILSAIQAIIHSARPAERDPDEPLIPAILGYKGILIRNPGRVADMPRQIAVSQGVIEILDDGKRYLADPDRELERLLLNTALKRDLVDTELLEAEKLQ